MKILILTQWFDPEPALKGLAFAQQLKSLGHEVEVLTGFPNYPGGKVYKGYRIGLYHKELVDGITVHRVALYPSHDASAIRRIATYTSFAITAALIGPFVIHKPDIMFVYHPPATIGLPAITISLLRRVPFVYDVNDLWPDTLSATGMLNNGLIISLIGKWCAIVYAFASRITVLSPGFKSRISERGVSTEKLKVIYNWCDDKSIAFKNKPAEEANPQMKDKFNVVFAGTMGKAQGLDSVIEAAKIVAGLNSRVQFVFVGDGIELKHLKSRVQREAVGNVIFLPRRPISEIGEILNAADALLVHLKDDPLFRVTIPSKTQAYLAVGKPVVMGVCGDAAELIRAAGAGVLCTPDNPRSIATAVCELASARTERLAAMAENGRSYYEQHLTLSAATKELEELFSEVLGIRVVGETGVTV